MSAKTPAQLSDAAAESIRALNHVTLQQPNNGWVYPGDAYTTVANLSLLAGYLPQAIGQIESFIGALEDGENLRSDLGEEDLPGRLVGFHMTMADAINQAHNLRSALNKAHQLLGPLAYKEPSA